MSRSLVTLSLVGMLTVAWQLAGQETKTETKPASKEVSKAPAKQSPAATYQDAKRAAELKILLALNNPVTVEFKETPLSDVMEFFGELLNVPVHIDEIAITDEGIPLDEPITFQAKEIAARSALEMMFEHLGITWVIRDEVLELTSELAATERLVTVVYDVSDLVFLVKQSPPLFGPGHGQGFGSGNFGGSGGGFGGGAAGSTNQQQQTNPITNGGGFHSMLDESTEKKSAKDESSEKQTHSPFGDGGLGGGIKPNSVENTKPVLNFDQLIELIQSATSGPWVDFEGLGGSISQHVYNGTNRKLLAIRQTQKVHREVEEILHGLRVGDQSNKKKDSPVVEYRKRTRVAEQKILNALNKTVALEFKETPLSDVVIFFADKLSVQVYLNEQALNDEGIAIDEPITFASKNIAARSALKIMLDRLDLCWIVRREMLYFTSKTHVEELLTLKVYDVTDVVNLVKEDDPNSGNTTIWQGGFGGNGYFNMADQKSDKDGEWKTVEGAGGSVETEETTIVDDFGIKGTIKPFDPVQGEPLLTKRAAKKAKKKLVPDFDGLIELIQNETGNPWEDIDGDGGRIAEFEHVGKKKYYLVIRQSFRVHQEIEDLLRDMRKVIHSSSGD